MYIKSCRSFRSSPASQPSDWRGMGRLCVQYSGFPGVVHTSTTVQSGSREIFGQIPQKIIKTTKGQAEGAEISSILQHWRVTSCWHSTCNVLTTFYRSIVCKVLFRTYKPKNEFFREVAVPFYIFIVLGCRSGLLNTRHSICSYPPPPL